MTQARVTGTVVRLDTRTGKTGDRMWRMHLIDVFQKGGSTPQVAFMVGDDGAIPLPDLPRVGDSLDLLVEFGIRVDRRGTANLSCNVVSRWEDQPNILGLLQAGVTAPAQAPASKAS